MSLTPDSPISFSYREEIKHDEYHIPLAFSALDPVTYFGAPLGDYGVKVFASLSIFEGEFDDTGGPKVSQAVDDDQQQQSEDHEQGDRDAGGASPDEDIA